MLNNERIFRLDGQTIVLDDFPAEGFILDIGGGGEGIIGQLKGQQVVAIDVFQRELMEAPGEVLKIIMDARELKFLDGSFNTVTAFFSFMFIHPDDHIKVFQEVFRVLAHQGKFMLWDIEIKQRTDSQRDMLVFQLDVKLPMGVVNTRYGTPYTEKPISIVNYLTLAQQTGLKVIEQTRNGQTFFCSFQKP